MLIKGVCDTNVIISGICFSGAPAKVLKYFLLDGQLLFSKETLLELREVLMRPKFDQYISRETRQLLLLEIATSSEIMIPRKIIRRCRDPADDKFLSVAVSAKADYLISGDQDLLVLETAGDTPIVTAKEFLTCCR